MNLEEASFLRLKQILGDRKAIPPVSPLIPVSKATWYAWIQAGRIPGPIKLGPRTSVWRRSDILELMERISASGN